MSWDVQSRARQAAHSQKPLISNALRALRCARLSKMPRYRHSAPGGITRAEDLPISYSRGKTLLFTKKAVSVTTIEARCGDEAILLLVSVLLLL